METIKISSEQELKANASLILRRINRAERGGLLFLLNPVIALGEAGFALSPPMMSHIRRGLRLGADDKKKIKQLEAEINRIAKQPINPISDEAVADLLFNRLSLKKPTAADARKAATAEPCPASSMYEPVIDAASPEPSVDAVAPSTLGRMNVAKLKAELKRRKLSASGTKPQLVARLGKVEAKPVPAISTELLQVMRRRHPVIPKILEVRALYGNGWRFMNEERYTEVKNGKSVGLIESVRFRTKTPASRRKPSKPRRPATRIGKKLRAAGVDSRIKKRLLARYGATETANRRKGG